MADKTLNFYSYNLQQDTNLMLVFEPPNEFTGLYRDQFPIVWKYIKFIGHGHSKATLHYSSRLGFGLAQNEDDKLVTSSTWTEVKDGDRTSITGNEDSLRFGPATRREDADSGVVCENKSNIPVNIYFGWVKKDGQGQRFESVFMWKSTQPGSVVTGKFKPILTAYIARDYPDDGIMRGPVEAGPIWTLNINELDEVTGWNFLEDAATGGFSIEPSLSL